MNTKFFTGEIKAVGDIEFILTAEVIDRDGDLIKVGGIKLDNFIKNPIMFYNHNSGESIGYWRNLRIENNALIGVPEFSKSELGQKIKSQVLDGSLRAVSIGFMIISQEGQQIDNRLVNVITESELFECSIVTLPANQDAVRIKEVTMEIKAGSELSAKNKELIQSAYDNLAKVLKLEDDAKEMENNFLNDFIELQEKVKELQENNLTAIQDEIVKLTKQIETLKEDKITLNQYLESANV